MFNSFIANLGWYIVCQYYPAGNVVKDEYFTANTEKQISGSLSVGVSEETNFDAPQPSATAPSRAIPKNGNQAVVTATMTPVAAVAVALIERQIQRIAL